MGRHALQRGGFALLSVPACDLCPFPTAQAPGSIRALGFSGPVPMATVKQTARLFPTAKSTNLQTVKKKKKKVTNVLKDKWVPQD